MTEYQKKEKDKAVLALKQMLVNGMAYNKFLHDNKSELEEYFVKDLEFDVDLFLRNANNIDFIYERYIEKGKEREINRALRSSITSNNGIHYIILNKYFDTIYGNLDKDDFSVNDYLYGIIEAIYGTDTVIEAISNPEILKQKNKEIKQYFKNKGLNISQHNLYLEFDNILKSLSEKMGEEIDIAINSVPNQDVYNSLERLYKELESIIHQSIYKRVDENNLEKDNDVRALNYAGLIRTINLFKELNSDLKKKKNSVKKM